MVEVVRFLRQYFRPNPSSVELLEASYTRDGRSLPATVHRPAARSRRAPAWIVLHGLTYHGVRHPSLERFASALAAGGHVVLIPEIHEWTRLQVAPALTTPTIRAAVDTLLGRDDVDPRRIGVFGFSFGATQALVSATDEQLAQRIRAIVAWGGYAGIPRLVHFGLTGEHEIDGVRERIEPDPYGRWIFGANYLTSIPGYEGMTRVGAALAQLALAAGRSRVFAGDATLRPLTEQLAVSLSGPERRAFELFAPVGAHDLAEARVLARALAETIVASDPLMDPTPFLTRVRIASILAHGRDDRLVPYTESIRLQRQLPPERLAASSITALFAHSGGTEPRLGVAGLAREGARFIATLSRILTTL
ncbi:MAG: dienelactone hydrolase family protein [Gemmatimonadota bacterium]